MEHKGNIKILDLYKTAFLCSQNARQKSYLKVMIRQKKFQVLTKNTTIDKGEIMHIV